MFAYDVYSLMDTFVASRKLFRQFIYYFDDCCSFYLNVLSPGTALECIALFSSSLSCVVAITHRIKCM